MSPARPLALALLLALAPIAARGAAPQRWEVDPAGSRAEFSVRFLGLVKINGRFARFVATIEPADEARVRVHARIETASLSMATEQQARWARSEEFFDSARYPTIEFASEPFARELLERGGAVVGQLRLRDTARETVLALRPVDCALASGGSCVLDATAAVPRSAFGMRTRRAMISDRVALALHIVARPLPDGA